MSIACSAVIRFCVTVSLLTLIVMMGDSVCCRGQSFEGGELKIIEGVPFLRLSGSYYEMGKQYGVLMKERMKELIEYKRVMDYYENKSHPPKWLLKLITPNRYLDFIEGMSDGSGIEYNDVFWACESPDPYGCTSILTKFNGRLLLGHNQDRYLPARFKVVVEFNPPDCHKYVVTSIVGTDEVLEGMNEKGICISNNAAKSTIGGIPLRWPTTRFMPVHCKNRQILEYASNLHDVDSLMEGYGTDASTLTVASSEDTSGIIYDKPFENIKKNYFGGNDYLFVTNYYLNKDLDDRPEACVRYRTIMNELKKRQVNSPDEMISLLANPGALYGVNNHNTIHSVVFDPQNLGLYMSFSQGYAAWGKWLRYDWRNHCVEVFREEQRKFDTVLVKHFDSYYAVWVRDTLAAPAHQDEMWKELYGYLGSIHVNAPLPNFTVYYDNRDTNADVEAVVPLTEMVRESGRIHFRDVDAAEMACMIHKGVCDSLSVISAPLYRWIVENNYEPCGPLNEVHLKGSWNERNSDEWLTEVRVAIEKKAKQCQEGQR